MTAKTYDQLVAEVAAQLPTTGLGQITALNVRTVFDDVIDSTVGLGGNVTVAQYGAKGDGVTDDTAALQAANDAAAAYGGSMYIPATANGYLVTDTITLTCRHVYGDAYLLSGSDLGTHILWSPTVVTDLKPCFDCPGADGSIVENLCVDGPTNYTVSTLVTSGAVNPGLLPNYSAFAVDVAGFQTSSTGKVTFNYCRAQYCKVGLLINNDDGHTTCNGCSWGANSLFGVYVRHNTETYRFIQTGIGGFGFAGVLFGTLPATGHNGGIAAYWIQSSIGFGPYGFYQCIDGGGASTANGCDMTFHNTDFEAIGECAIQALDSDTSASSYMFTTGPGFSFDGSGSFWLPDTIIPAGQKQHYAVNLGNVNTFKVPYGGPHPFTACDPSVNTNGKVARVYVDGSSAGQFDSDALLLWGGIDIINPDQNVDNLRFLPANSYVNRQEKATKSALLQTANMLLNPETAANWSNLSNVVVTTSPYATLKAGALASATFPRQFFEELGDNPTGIVFTPSANWFAALNFNPNPFPVLANSHFPAMSFWIVKAGANIGLRARLSCASSVNVYDNTYFFDITATKIWGVGQNSGGQDYLQFQIFANPTDVVYVFGLMVSLDDLAQYNPTQGPSLIGMPFLQSQTTFTSATAGAASALPATPLGYLEVNLGGTLVKVPYYSV